MSRRRVQLITDHGCLGDQICFIAAAREYAKYHKGVEVVVSAQPEIVAAYPDRLVSVGTADVKIPSNPESRHRAKRASPDHNYLGTYMAELRLPTQLPPRIELPNLPTAPGLLPLAYIAIQPYSGFATNPERGLLQAFVNVCRQIAPEWPLVATGSPDTPQDLVGVDYSRLGDPTSVLSVIQHAGLVLTPRSAAAHIASAYGVPSFVWTPDDGENWHLDYPEWPHYRARLHEEPRKTIQQLAEFAMRVRSGFVARPTGLRLALTNAGIADGVRVFMGEGTNCPAALVDLGACRSDSERIRRVIERVHGQDPGPYPPYLNVGNAVQYVLEDATTTCVGRGIDVGSDRWPFPGATPIRDETGRNAYVLPDIDELSLDFVFSSHCLEHLHRPEEALALWAAKLKPGGVLFLYLPHPAMTLWHPEGPWGGDHKWIPSPRHVRRMVEQSGLEVRVCTEAPDAYWSFRCVATKGRMSKPVGERTSPTLAQPRTAIEPTPVPASTPSTLRLGAAIPVLNEWRFIPAVVGQLLTVVDRVVIMHGSRAQSGVPVVLSPDVPELDSRVDILEGNWSTEAETRNAGMEYLADCDYVFMIDSDEILLDGDLQKLRELCESRLHQVLSVRLHTHWKTPDYRIEPPEHGTIKMVLRRDVRIVGVREVEAPVHETDVWCRHLSYVRTDEEVREKMRISGHSHEMLPRWYEEVWKAWDAKPDLEDLHPVHPPAYRRAVRASDPELNAVLARWGCAWNGGAP